MTVEISMLVVVVDSSRKWLPRCVESIARQRGCVVELIIVDNTTALDVTIPVHGAIGHVVHDRNPVHPCFFVANNNRGIHLVTSPCVVLVNCDAFLDADFSRRVLDVLATHPDVGMVSGKLRQLEEDGSATLPRRIDSSGMLLTLGQRHHDRGAGDIDRGQYDRGEYVFGASGAAAVLRMASVNDVLLDGECLDPEFVHGREDAELALRMQLLGWRCYYEPTAMADHIRSLRQDGRDKLPTWLKRQHVKDRFVMRINNVPSSVALVLLPTLALRDLQILIFVLLIERESIPAFGMLWSARRQLLERRRDLMRRRRASVGYMLRLFLGGMQDTFYRIRHRSADV